MRDWRDRGFVPDSDDEEDYEDLDFDSHSSQPKRPPVTQHDPVQDGLTSSAITKVSGHPNADDHKLLGQGTPIANQTVTAVGNIVKLPKVVGSSSASQVESQSAESGAGLLAQNAERSTAELLAQQLQVGLQTCKEVLLSKTANGHLSDDDSPLSSLPSSPETFAEFELQAHAAVDTAVAFDAPQVQAAAFQAGPPARTFRQRAPLQLHPFTLEYAKYQQQCRQRGIVPIRPDNFHAVYRNQETQISDAANSSQFRSPSPAPPAKNTIGAMDEEESQSPVRGQRSVAHPSHLAFDDELPDLLDILRGSGAPLQTQASNERPRSKQDGPGAHGHRGKKSQFPRLGHGADEANVADPSDGESYDLPLSPPHSSSRSSSRAPTRGESKVTTLLRTPRPLLTPVVSSDYQSHKRPAVEISSSSDAESDAERSEHERMPVREEPKRYLDIRKRIKGVLPASWLKLDAKQQSKPSERRQGISPIKVDATKGVAKRVSNSTSRGNFAFDIVGEESDSASSDQEHEKDITSKMQVNLDHGDGMLIDDVIEDNTIDAMLPTRPSVSRRSGIKIRGQRKLKETWTDIQTGESDRDRGFATSSLRVRRLQRNGQRRPKRQRRVSQHDAFDVLNAPGLRLEAKYQAPRDVKIAARSGTKRSPGHPRKPVQKVFQLETREGITFIDTDLGTPRFPSDVARSGFHAPSTTRQRLSSKKRQHPHPTHHRRPDERSETRQNGIQETIRRLKTSTDKTLEKLQVSRNAQQPAEGFEEPTAPNKSGRVPGHVSTHRNRSGAGMLWSHSLVRPAVPEAAQINRSTKIARLVQHPQQSPDTELHEPPTAATTIYRTRIRRRRKTTPKQTRHVTSAEEMPMLADNNFEPRANGAKMTSQPSESSHDQINELLWAMETMTTHFKPLAETSTADETIPNDWKQLCSAVARFLRSNAETEESETIHTIGFEAVKVCLAVFNECPRLDDNNILQSYFQRYSENNMIELFTVPSLNAKRSGMGISRNDTSTKSNPTDFDIFLDLAAVVLQRRVQMASCSDNPAKDAKRIRALVSSLSPNNGRSLSHDQVLLYEDFISMANTYALYTVLYTRVPAGCQPRLAQIHQLIDFASSHWAICELALKAWFEMTIHAVAHDGSLGDVRILGSWMRQVILQMYQKLESIGASGDYSWPHVQGINELNRKHTIHQIEQILGRWCEALRHCSSAVVCCALMEGENLSQIIMLSKGELIDEDDIAIGVSSAVRIYCSKLHGSHTDDLCDRIRSTLRDVLERVLSTKYVSSAKLRALTDVWFDFAQISVEQRHKNWDDYLTAPSSLSFSLIADSEHSRQSQVLFMSRILEDDPLSFELDREMFYKTWIQGVMQPQQNLCFENELTYQVMVHDTEVFPLQSLEDVMLNTNWRTSIQEFDAVRLDILKYAVQCIHGLQFGSKEDSQDLMQPAADVGQGRNLLQLMCSTMKSQWRGLAPQYRQQYEVFVIEVIRYLQIYTYAGFEIDPWFIDPRESEFPKTRLSLDQMFLQPAQDGPGQLEEGTVQSFRRFCSDATSVSENDFATALTAALAAHDDDVFDSNGKVLVNTEMQVEFMQNVVLVYIEELFHIPGYTDLTAALTSALTSILETYHLRVNAEEEESILSFIILSQHVLSTIVRTVCTGMYDDQQDRRLSHQLHLVLRLAGSCIKRFFQLQEWADDSELVMEAVESVYRHARLVDQWISTSGAVGVGQNEMESPTLSQREQDLRAMVRADLKRHFHPRTAVDKQPEPGHLREEAVLEFRRALCVCGISEDETISYVAESMSELVLGGC